MLIRSEEKSERENLINGCICNPSLKCLFSGWTLPSKVEWAKRVEKQSNGLCTHDPG